MYKMIIADDEPAVRDYIRYIVKRYSLPFQICGEAVDGEQAVEMADRYEPDFVIMDINMPIMNGLDAAEAIRKKYPDVVIYILTAYSQFDYAHRAVQNQVADYLLKPIRPEELVKVLKKGIASALRRRLSLHRTRRMAKQIAKDRPIVAKQILSELLRSDSDNPNAVKLLQNISKKESFYPAAVLSMTHWRDDGAAISHRLDERLTQDSIMRFGEHSITVSISREVVMIFRRWNNDLCIEIQAQLKEWALRYNIKLCAGLRIVVEPSRIGKDYRSAKKQQEAGLFWEKQGLFVPTGADNDEVEVDYNEIQQQIRDFLIERQSNVAKIIVGQFWDEARQKMCQREYVQAMAIKIANNLIDKYAEYIISVNDANLLRTNFTAEANKAFYANDLERCLCSLVDTLGDYSCPNEHNLAEQSVKWAVDYINANYHTDLSLDKIAGKLFVSTGYFCRIFKRYTGEGYATYLTNIRLKKAKEILMSGKYTVAEVARMVGFNDASYFSSVFKKTFNQSPSQLATLVTRQDS